MKTYTSEELKTIIENHRHWLKEDCEGWEDMKANLRGADLRVADLRWANLRWANLSGADLRWADLEGANLRWADLYGANLRWANLRGADLEGADLYGANLSWADLHGANLRGAKDLNNVQYNEKTSFFAIQCPESGAFEAYKKALRKGGGAAIVHMLVPSTAKRSSATSRKCRVSEAKVLDITSIDGNEELTEAMSRYDNSFVYRKGDTVKVDNFCDDRWTECAAGINCFITRREAVNY